MKKIQGASTNCKTAFKKTALQTPPLPKALQTALFPTVFLMFFLLAAGFAGALDVRSDSFIDFLLTLKAPGAPVVFEDSVVFTAPSTYKSIGISFANENFREIHRFKRLMIPEANTPAFDPESKEPRPEPVRDSGIMFYVHTPKTQENIEYRLVIDGVWERDPLNPRWTLGDGGLELSIAPVPVIKNQDEGANGNGLGALVVNYKGLPGETITLAGDFNGWDPFMYELKEQSPGIYFIKLPLPPGIWHYVLFNRGQPVLDQKNMNRTYKRNGLNFTSNVIEIK